MRSSKRCHFLAAGLDFCDDVSCACVFALPVTFSPASAAPATAPSAAPAAALANTAFNASLALPSSPVACFFADLRGTLFFVEPFLELRLEAAAFLDAELFELVFEADLFDVSRAVGSITSKTLVIHGAEDRYVPLANAAALAEAIPDAKLRVLADAGHLVFIERFADINREVVVFLKSRNPQQKPQQKLLV